MPRRQPLTTIPTPPIPTGKTRPTSARLQAGWNAPGIITIGLLEGEISERWPDPGVIAIRRSGGLKPLTVNFTITGTATRGADYALPAGNTHHPARRLAGGLGQHGSAADAMDAEGDETIVLTLAAGTGYTIGATAGATVTLRDEPADALPQAKAAARFLVQAAFGPDQDAPATPT